MAEDIFRKGALTQGGNLSRPDLGAASFSQQGVVDQSGLFRGQAKAAGIQGIANAVEQFGNVALDLDKRFALSQLETQVRDEAINPFLQSRQPGFAESQQGAFQEAAIDNFELTQRANAFRDEIGEGASIEKLDPEFAAVTKRLKNAKRQGVMSEAELQIRIKALTREAISKRPGLLNELTAHAQNTLNLSGAREQASLVDQLANAEAKADAEVRNRTLSFLDKVFEPFDPSESTDELVARANRFKTKRNAFESLKRDEEIRKVVENTSENEIAASPLPRQVIIGGFDTASTDIMDLFTQDLDANGIKNAVLQANNLFQQFQADIDTNPAFIKVAHRPEMKKLRDDWVGNLKSTIDNLKAFKTGDEALGFLQNQLSTVRTLDEINAFKDFSPAKIENIAKLAPFAGDLVMQDKDRRGKMISLVDSIMDGGLKSPALEEGYQRTRQSNKSNFASLLGADGLLASMVPSTEDSPAVARTKSPQEYQEAADTVITFLQNEQNPSKRQPAIRDIVKEMGDPRMRNFYDNLPVETQTQFLDLLEEQTQIVANTIDDVFKQADSNDIPIQSKIIEGRMRFISEDNSPATRKFLQRENMRVATAHQEIVQAFSIRFNKSFTDTSDMLRKVFTKQDRTQLLDVLDQMEQNIDTQRDLQQSQTNEQVSDDFLNRVSQIESGGNPNAKASTSSALGEFQFIESTWLDIMNKNFPDVTEGKSRQEILALRTDPGLSRRAATALANENAGVLERSGVEINDANLYLAHFLGSTKAAELLRSPDNTEVEDILPSSSVKANRSILEDKRVKDVVAWAQDKMRQ